MIGPDGDWNDPVRIVHRTHPCDRMPDPGQAEPARSQHRFLRGNGADLPAISPSQTSELGPEIGAGNAAGRGAHLDDEGRTASAQFLGKRSEEHTSELQSLMRISYAVFCLKKKTTN